MDSIVVVATDCVLMLTTGALRGAMVVTEVIMPVFEGMEDGLPAPV